MNNNIYICQVCRQGGRVLQRVAMQRYHVTVWQQPLGPARLTVAQTCTPQTRRLALIQRKTSRRYISVCHETQNWRFFVIQSSWNFSILGKQNVDSWLNRISACSMFTSYVIDIARCSYKVPLSPGLENCSSKIHNKDVGQQNTKPIRQKPIENALPASAHSLRFATW